MKIKIAGQLDSNDYKKKKARKNMKATNAKGIVIKDGKSSIKTLSIRAGKNNFITLSLEDDIDNVKIQVNYKDIKKVVEAL